MQERNRPVDSAYSRRTFLRQTGSLTAGAALILPVFGLAVKAAGAADAAGDKSHSAIPSPANSLKAVELIGDRMRDQLKGSLADITDWIMTLDLGSGEVKNAGAKPSPLKWVQGNFARVLLAGHKIYGNEKYLAEAIRWCDTMITLQQPVTTSDGRQAGYWADHGATGKLYLADAGTFATSIALTYKHVDRQRKKNTSRRWNA